MNLSEYANFDAVDLARLVAKGDVRPAELAALALEAADAVNPAVSAIVEQWTPEEADLATATSTHGPLAGVPFLIKDLAIQMAGRRCELGSRLAEGLVAADDSLLMRHYRRAGLVTIGRTTTPEMAFSTETESVQQGATRNPWNVTLSAGGSSGGSGAAVAAGIVPIAHATDAAGSIRVPAAYNGLFGLKPTRGRTSNGPALDEVFGGLGVQLGLSRSVRDSAALMDAVQGYSPGDPYYTPAPAEGFLSQVGRDPGRLRIGLMLHPWNGVQTARSHRAGCARRRCPSAVARSSRRGGGARAGVSWEAFVHANAQIWCATLVRWIDGLAAATGRPIAASTLEPSTLANYRYGQEARAVDFAAAFEVRNTVSRAVGAWFDDMDVLMTPRCRDAGRARQLQRRCRAHERPRLDRAGLPPYALHAASQCRRYAGHVGAAVRRPRYRTADRDPVHGGLRAKTCCCGWPGNWNRRCLGPRADPRCGLVRLKGITRRRWYNPPALHGSRGCIDRRRPDGDSTRCVSVTAKNCEVARIQREMVRSLAPDWEDWFGTARSHTIAEF